MPGFRTTIDYTRDGEQVRAGVDNRAPRQIAENTQYLLERLELATAGTSLIAFNKTIKSDVLLGMPVYFNSTTRQFEKAIAQTDTDATTGQLVTAASSQVAGIVLNKLSATAADILLDGVAELNMSSAIDTVAAGLYYLSGAEAGKLTATRPPVGVRVLQVLQPGTDSGTWEVCVRPNSVDFLEAHRHVKFSLVALPAGDHVPPAPGQDHDILNPDDSIEGWLPATHGSFTGIAPTGAKYGYNLAASALGEIWPPIPVENAVLLMYKQGLDDADRVPLMAAVPSALVVINRNGIWWMTDCYDSVPWPTTLNTLVEASISESHCLPLQNSDVLLDLWLTTSLFFNNDFGVLSLTAREGSGLQVFCQGTDDERSVGHLELALDLALAQGDADRAGHLVIKEFEDQQFHRGPIVESIRSGSAELVVTSDVDEGDDGQFYGNITISANLDINGGELPITLVRLDRAEEANYQETLGIDFKSSREGSIRCRLEVPARLTLPAGTQVKLRFWVMGRVAGTLPSSIFELSYRILPRPTAGVTTPVTLPLTDTALAMTTTAVLANANEYVEMESAAFDVTAGDQILFSMTRAAPDGYAGDLHILKQVGVLVAEA